MSAENVVKQEPVDSGYERAPENIAVKKEPNENDSDEDLTWMDDLEFLNEIDLVSDNDSQPSNTDQMTEHSKSDAASSYAGSERADTPGPRGGRKRKRNRKKRTVEAEETPPPIVYDPEPISIKSEIEHVVKAIKRQRGNLEVEQALKHIQRMKELENQGSGDASASQADATLQTESTTVTSASLSINAEITKSLNELLAKKATKSSLADVTATSPCSPASLYNLLAANNFQVPEPTPEPQPRCKKKRVEPNYTQEMLRFEIERAVENIKRMKEGKETPSTAVQVPAPVQIKQEKVSPPREIPEKPIEQPAPASDPDFTLRSIKEEPMTQSRNCEPTSNSQPPNTAPPVNDKSSLSDDAAFLANCREKIRSRDLPSTSATRTPSADIPAAVRIKSEPVDKYDFPKATTTTDEPPEKQPLVTNPVSLKVMPEPMRIKEEPVDDGDSSGDRIMYPTKRIEAGKVDDKPMPHRQRVVKFVKDTIKNFDLFESNKKLQRRFFFTPTFMLREKADDLAKYRSPLKSSNHIKYEFSTPQNKIDTLKFGVEKLSENSAKICHLLGFNAYDLGGGKSKLEKSDDVDEASESANMSPFFVNVACQTPDLSCNTCTARKLKIFTDREAQTLDTGDTSSSKSSYDGVSQATLHVLSQMNSAQQTAIKEFADLLRGPSPTSMNDVMRMREKLMDIFTLAQSSSNNTSTSATDPLNINRRVSTRFDQPDPNRQPAPSIHNSLFPAASSPILTNDCQSQRHQPIISTYNSPPAMRPLFPSVQAPVPHQNPQPTSNAYPPAPVPYPQHAQGYMHPVQTLPNPYARRPPPSSYAYRLPMPAMVPAPGNPYRPRNPHDPRSINVQVHPRQQ